MTELHATGLTADWINGWLAAVGVTVLLQDARLGWTREAIPTAVFEIDNEADFSALIAERLSATDLSGLTGCNLKREASQAEYRTAAEQSRRTRDWTLACVLTDLVGRRKQRTSGIEPSAFYVAGPGTVGTLHDRVARCNESIAQPVAEAVRSSLLGTSTRAQVNGLGFDYRRIAVGEMAGDFGRIYVDPVVELLAFCGLGLMPVRGNGREAASRGWRRSGPARRRALAWPVWEHRLDRWAIDALLGLAFRETAPNEWSTLVGATIFAGFETVSYSPKATADPTRGYASRRVL